MKFHLYFSKAFISLRKNKRKCLRYRSVSLGDEPVTNVETMVRSWLKRPTTFASPEAEVPDVVSPLDS